MNKDQITGLLERGVTVLLTYIVAKGWIDMEIATELGPILIGIISLVYAWYINRPKMLIQSASQVPGTTIVTKPEIANELGPNVVSAESNVVRKVID